MNKTGGQTFHVKAIVFMIFIYFIHRCICTRKDGYIVHYTAYGDKSDTLSKDSKCEPFDCNINFLTGSI